MALPLLVVAAQVARMGVQGAIRSGLGKAAIKKAQTEFKLGVEAVKEWLKGKEG